MILKKYLRVFAIVSFFVSAAVLILHSRYFNMIGDDAYISFRYAYNWAVGHGLVFNPGEHVEGYTNLLWVLLLGLAFKLGVEIPTAAQLLGISFSIACLILVYHLGQTLQTQNKAVGILAAWFLVINGSFAFWTVGGLEVPLFAFLILSASYMYVLSQLKQDRRALIASSVLWGITYLARPEGALLFLLTIICLTIQITRTQEKTRWVDLIYFILAGSFIIGVHMAWRLSYYGYPLPNTFYAKVGSDFFAQIYRGFIYVRDFFWVYGLIFISLPIAFLIRPSIRKFPTTYLLLLSGSYLGYVAGVGGDSLQNFRFIVPVIPLLYLITLESWYQLLPMPSGLPSRQGYLQLARFLAILIIGICFITTFSMSKRGVYLLEDVAYGGKWVQTDEIDDTYIGWKQAGMWLKLNTPIEYHIALQPAGYIPFYSQRFSLDMLGLNDTHIAHLPIKMGSGKAGHEKWDGDYILSRRPEIIILGMGVYPNPIQNLTDRSEIEQIMQPGRAGWEIWGNPQFIAWYKPASALLPNGQYLDFFIKRDSPVEIFPVPNVRCNEVVEIPLTGLDQVNRWRPYSTNNVTGLLKGDNGSITFTYLDNPQKRDLYTFGFFPDPAINNVIALRARVNIANGTYLSIEARSPSQLWKKFLSNYRGWGEWETVLFPVEVEPLSGIAISIGEPGLVKNAGLTYRVSIESISVLTCQDK
jgi:arabinofuranosyltransferase